VDAWGNVYFRNGELLKLASGGIIDTGTSLLCFNGFDGDVFAWQTGFSKDLDLFKLRVKEGALDKESVLPANLPLGIVFDEGSTAVYSIDLPEGLSEEMNVFGLENLPYYPESVSRADDYIGERCVLDLYVPEQLEGFPTVIWFHGGGLKAGNKYIPEELKEKGMAVVAVNYRLYPKIKAPVYIEDAGAL